MILHSYTRSFALVCILILLSNFFIEGHVQNHRPSQQSIRNQHRDNQRVGNGAYSHGQTASQQQQQQQQQQPPKVSDRNQKLSIDTITSGAWSYQQSSHTQNKTELWTVQSSVAQAIGVDMISTIAIPLNLYVMPVGYQGDGHLGMSIPENLWKHWSTASSISRPERISHGPKMPIYNSLSGSNAMVTDSDRMVDQGFFADIVYDLNIDILPCITEITDSILYVYRTLHRFEVASKHSTLITGKESSPHLFIEPQILTKLLQTLYTAGSEFIENIASSYTLTIMNPKRDWIIESLTLNDQLDKVLYDLLQSQTKLMNLQNLQPHATQPPQEPDTNQLHKITYAFPPYHGFRTGLSLTEMFSAHEHNVAVWGKDLLKIITAETNRIDSRLDIESTHIKQESLEHRSPWSSMSLFDYLDEKIMLYAAKKRLEIPSGGEQEIKTQEEFDVESIFGRNIKQTSTAWLDRLEEALIYIAGADNVSLSNKHEAIPETEPTITASTTTTTTTTNDNNQDRDERSKNRNRNNRHQYMDPIHGARMRMVEELKKKERNGTKSPLLSTTRSSHNKETIKLVSSVQAAHQNEKAKLDTSRVNQDGNDQNIVQGTFTTLSVEQHKKYKMLLTGWATRVKSIFTQFGTFLNAQNKQNDHNNLSQQAIDSTQEQDIWLQGLTPTNTISLLSHLLPTQLAFQSYQTGQDLDLIPLQKLNTIGELNAQKFNSESGQIAPIFRQSCLTETHIGSNRTAVIDVTAGAFMWGGGKGNSGGYGTGSPSLTKSHSKSPTALPNADHLANIRNNPGNSQYSNVNRDDIVMKYYDISGIKGVKLDLSKFLKDDEKTPPPPPPTPPPASTTTSTTPPTPPPASTTTSTTPPPPTPKTPTPTTASPIETKPLMYSQPPNDDYRLPTLYQQGDNVRQDDLMNEIDSDEEYSSFEQMLQFSQQQLNDHNDESLYNDDFSIHPQFYPEETNEELINNIINNNNTTNNIFQQQPLLNKFQKRANVRKTGIGGTNPDQEAQQQQPPPQQQQQRQQHNPEHNTGYDREQALREARLKQEQPTYHQPKQKRDRSTPPPSSNNNNNNGDQAGNNNPYQNKQQQQQQPNASNTQHPTGPGTRGKSQLFEAALDELKKKGTWPSKDEVRTKLNGNKKSENIFPSAEAIEAMLKKAGLDEKGNPILNKDNTNNNNNNKVNTDNAPFPDTVPTRHNPLNKQQPTKDSGTILEHDIIAQIIDTIETEEKNHQAQQDSIGQDTILKDSTLVDDSQVEKEIKKQNVRRRNTDQFGRRLDRLNRQKADLEQSNNKSNKKNQKQNSIKSNLTHSASKLENELLMLQNLLQSELCENGLLDCTKYKDEYETLSKIYKNQILAKQNETSTDVLDNPDGAVNLDDGIQGSKPSASDIEEKLKNTIIENTEVPLSLLDGLHDIELGDLREDVPGLDLTDGLVGPDKPHQPRHKENPNAIDYDILDEIIKNREKVQSNNNNNNNNKASGQKGKAQDNNNNNNKNNMDYYDYEKVLSKLFEKDVDVDLSTTADAALGANTLNTYDRLQAVLNTMPGVDLNDPIQVANAQRNLQFGNENVNGGFSMSAIDYYMAHVNSAVNNYVNNVVLQPMELTGVDKLYYRRVHFTLYVLVDHDDFNPLDLYNIPFVDFKNGQKYKYTEKQKESLRTKGFDPENFHSHPKAKISEFMNEFNINMWQVLQLAFEQTRIRGQQFSYSVSPINLFDDPLLYTAIEAAMTSTISPSYFSSFQNPVASTHSYLSSSILIKTLIPKITSNTTPLPKNTRHIPIVLLSLSTRSQPVLIDIYHQAVARDGVVIAIQTPHSPTTIATTFNNFQQSQSVLTNQFVPHSPQCNQQGYHLFMDPRDPTSPLFHATLSLLFSTQSSNYGLFITPHNAPLSLSLPRVTIDAYHRAYFLTAIRTTTKIANFATYTLSLVNPDFTNACILEQTYTSSDSTSRNPYIVEWKDKKLYKLVRKAQRSVRYHLFKMRSFITALDSESAAKYIRTLVGSAWQYRYLVDLLLSRMDKCSFQSSYELIQSQGVDLTDPQTYGIYFNPEALALSIGGYLGILDEDSDAQYIFTPPPIDRKEISKSSFSLQQSQDYATKRGIGVYVWICAFVFIIGLIIFRAINDVVVTVQNKKDD